MLGTNGISKIQMLQNFKTTKHKQWFCTTQHLVISFQAIQEETCKDIPGSYYKPFFLKT